MENKEDKMKNKRTKKDKIIILILILIILAQVVFRLYLGSQKQYIHMDEAYSYGLMNYHSIDIHQNEDFYDTWHNKEYYKDYLAVGSGEVGDWSPVYENQKNDVHPPLFYLLLRVFSSFKTDTFSMWSGILLNIVISVISIIFTYLVACKIFKNKIYALIASIVCGFNISSLETTMFIRMYELTKMNLMILALLHLKLYEEKEVSLKYPILIGIFALMGSLTHYYNMIFLAIMYLILAIKYIKNKQWKNLIKYTIPLGVAAILSLVIFPHSITHIFFGYRGEGILSSMTDLGLVFKNLGIFTYVIQKDIFNQGLILILVIAIIGYVIIRNKKKENNKEKESKNDYIWLVMIPTIIYFLFVGATSPYQEIRYLMPISSFIIIGFIYWLKHIYEKIWDIKKTTIAISILFSVILILPLILRTNIFFLYNNKESIVKEIKEKQDVPAIYVQNTQDNRFLDDIYLFSILDNSYILSVDGYEERNMKQDIKEVVNKNENIKDNLSEIIIFINYNMPREEYLEDIKEELQMNNITKLDTLNASEVYYLSK